MSHSLFDLIGAYNQIGCFLVALLCLAIGGFLLGNALYWRLHAERVTGTITGLREVGGFYYTVYKYTLANGQAVEATSDSGSGSPLGNETGKTLSLLVFPSHPEQARRAGNYLFEIIGFFFAAPGVFFLYLACTVWPVTKMTGIVLGAMIAYAAMRLHKVILPKEKRMPMAQWKAATAQKQDEIKTLPIQRMEDVMPPAERQKALAQQARGKKQAGIIFLLLGPILVAGGIYMGQKTLTLTREGVRAPGMVVSLDSEWSNHNTVYHAVVNFNDVNGNAVRFRDGEGSNPPMYRAGEAVTVLYLAAQPEKSATIDRGIWNWLPPVLVFSIGAAMLLAIPVLLRKNPAAS